MNILKEKPVTLDLPAALANLCRQGRPSRVFHFEHGLEEGIKKGLCDRFDLLAGLDPAERFFNLRREIRVMEFVGLELIRVFPAGIVWPGLPAGTTTPPPAIGPIQSWSDFESYPWPQIGQVDLTDIEWFNRNLPENMAMWTMTYLFQMVSNLFGFEPLCMMLYEDRDLVKAVMEKVATFYLQYTETLCHFPRFGAINIGDDMGHKTGTLISPNDLREIFVPWHKRIIETAHNHGKLGLFHSCGQIEAVMDDLIDTVRIDAKHSTQDVVEPITRAKQRYGSRVALLGGVDVDFILRAKTDQVRVYTRNILDACIPGGGFALGVGNWVQNEIPLDNYLAILEEARKFSL
jgi:uroporphyrinogen decarboxylase